MNCKAYVDLNPIRAGMAKTPEASDYTGIQERLGITSDHLQSAEHSDSHEPLNLTELLPFAGNEHENNQPQYPPFSLTDHLQLVDWTGRAVRGDKRGAIPKDIPPLLERLNLLSEDWLNTCCHIGRHYKRAIGPVAKLTELCDKLGQRWMHGISHCRRLYASATQ